MTIEFPCTSCTSTLRVEDQHAGKKARCPKCGMVQNVPGDMLSTAPGPGDRSLHQRWLLRTPDGETYGPVPKSELDQWFAEGRISPQCLLQREGQAQWETSLTLYPDLSHAEPLDASSAATGEARPFTPMAAPVAGRVLRPNNGITILVFGILGLFFLWCPIFALIAWIMGANDLAAMRRGEMDTSGRGMVQAGYVLGIVCTLLGALSVLSCCGLQIAFN